MSAEILPIESQESFTAAVHRAAELLRAGQIVAVPTETVYGLAANAFDADAVRKIYEAKGRPPKNPLIVHVASIEMARQCVQEWTAEAARAAAHFWPGALTLVLPKSDRIPPIVTAGGATVGIRWPAHPFIRELIRVCAFPLAAPSANLSNQVSPTTAAHVFESLKDRVPLIIDAGPASVGIESTVLDLTNTPARVLRPGMITPREIEAVLGRTVALHSETSGHLRSPGQLHRHYSPRARLLLASWRTDEELLDLIQRLNRPLREIHILAHEIIPRKIPCGRVAVIPPEPQAYARALYQELHRCDQLGAGVILVETPPENEQWFAIRDRLARASAFPESAP